MGSQPCFQICEASMCNRNVTPSPAEKWGRRGTEFSTPPVLGVGVGKGPFSCFVNVGEMGFVPSYIFVLLLPSSGQGAAGESGSCCSAPSRQQSPVRARSWYGTAKHLHQLPSFAAWRVKLRRAGTSQSPPHIQTWTALACSLRNTHLAADRHKKPPGRSEVITALFDKKLILILNPTVQFLWRHRYCIPEIKWVFLSQTRCWPPQPSPPGRNRRSAELQAEPRANVSQAGLVSFQHQ